MGGDISNQKLNANHFMIIGVLVGTALVKAVFQGNRGSLIQYFFVVACAFILAVPYIKLKHKMYGAGQLACGCGFKL